MLTDIKVTGIHGLYDLDVKDIDIHEDPYGKGNKREVPKHILDTAHPITWIENPPFTFFYGPNGTGKTTLLKILNVIFNPEKESLGGISFDTALLSFETGEKLNVQNSGEEKLTYTLHEEGKETLLGTFKTLERGPIWIKKYTLKVIDATEAKECPLFQRKLNTEQVELLTRIITPLRFLAKEFEINENGIKVLNKFTHKNINPKYLSRGEKNILNIIDALLFEPAQLTFISKPETSLHLLLQQNFTRILLTVLLHIKGKAIIITHSPGIIEIFTDKMHSISRSDGELYDR